MVMLLGIDQPARRVNRSLPSAAVRGEVPGAGLARAGRNSWSTATRMLVARHLMIHLLVAKRAKSRYSDSSVIIGQEVRQREAVVEEQRGAPPK